MIKRLILFTIFLSIVAVACNSDGKGKKTKKGETGFVSEESLGLRKTDLYSENSTEGDLGVFDAPAPGQSEMIERSFENAPPLIPHTTEGFLPIKKDQNLCLSCHMPNVAEAVKATSIPKSHFMNFRPQIKEKGGKIVAYQDNDKSNTVTIESLGDKLSNARYNCSQCHVPQADITVEVKNTFVADFRNENSKNRSNFADVVDEGVK
jgi:cytochrome c-type protein NapB